MTRVLHVLSTSRAEGTPNLVLSWLRTRTLDWQGVVTLHDEPADLRDQLRAVADAYEEHSTFTSGRRKFRRILALTYNAVKRHRPDVVICWNTGFAGWVCSGARFAGCRNLLVHMGNPVRRGGKADWITRYVGWPLMVLRAKAVCCSEYIRDGAREVPLLKDDLFQTVYNCLDVRAIDHRAQRVRPVGTRHKAIMVATLEHHKDHPTLLRAVPLILKQIPDFHLSLVGAGSRRAELEKMAVELSCNSAVEFLGMRRDVPELLAQADLFIFSTTLQEGLGIAMFEALAAKVPVIASDVPACREALAGGSWGKLVPPNDHIALAEGIINLLLHPPTEEQLERSAAYARSFRPEKMIVEYLAQAGIHASDSKTDRAAT